nr:uncharacterized protein LOC119169550 [Rhipicephalus microplus]
MAGVTAGRSQSFQCSLQVVRKFPLKRYASHASNKINGPPSDNESWKVYISTTDDPLLLYITDTDMLVVNQGSYSHECVFLLNSKDWVRGVMKGNSMLILSRFQGDNERRFRVEFDGYADKSAVEQCQICTELLSQYFTFQEPCEPARSTGINPNDFFKQQFESPEVLREIVKACLQDPSFPNFVKQVDDTLQSLLSTP